MQNRYAEKPPLSKAYFYNFEPILFLVNQKNMYQHIPLEDWFDP